MQYHDYAVHDFAFKTLSIKNIFPRVYQTVLIQR